MTNSASENVAKKLDFPVMKQRMRPKEKYLPAYALIVLLPILLFSNGWLFYQDSEKLLPYEPAPKTFINGEWTSEIERAFSDHLQWKEGGMLPWGVVQQIFFQTAYQGAFLGKGNWLFHRGEFTSAPNTIYQEALKIYWIKQVQSFLAQHNVGLVVVVVPSKVRIYGEMLETPQWPKNRKYIYPRFIESLWLMNIPTLSGLEPLMDVKASGVNAYYPMDTHWSLEGAQGVAKRTVEFAEKACAGLSYPPVNYEVTMEEVSYKQDMLSYIPLGLVTQYLEQELKITSSFSLSNPEQGLFDKPETPIATVGTSYSAVDAFQFVDSLRLAFKADIADFSVAGQGAFAPMVNFLTKTDWNNHPYQLVVWEMPERHIHEYFKTNWPIGVLSATPPPVLPCMASETWEEAR